MLIFTGDVSMGHLIQAHLHARGLRWPLAAAGRRRVHTRIDSAGL